MKKFLTQKINFTYALIVMLALTAGVSAVSAGYALPGQTNNIDPIIHRGGGEQVIDSLRIGDCNGTSGACTSIGALDARAATDSVALFDTISNARLFVLDFLNPQNRTYIATNPEFGQSYWSGTYNGLPIANELQTVNVLGNVRATNLTSPVGTEESVCITPSGNLVKCPSDVLVNGSCGSADGVPTVSSPSTGLCASGTQSSVSGGNGPFSTGSAYTWTCFGEAGGSNDTCSAPYQIAGSCGSADGQSYSSSPTSGLCGAGTASAVSDNGPFGQPAYDWTCTGTNGGATESCSANYETGASNGQCVIHDQGPYKSQPATNNANACVNGNYSNTLDSLTTWQWNCSGTNGGESTLCQAARATDSPTCRTYGGTHNQQPATNTANGCEVGSYSDLPDNAAQWRWQCLLDGQTSTCSANLGGNGTCGTSCTSDAQCQQGIFCYQGGCDMYDNNNNGIADDFDGIC